MNTSALISWIGDADLVDFYRSALSRHPDLQRQMLGLMTEKQNKNNFHQKATSPSGFSGNSPLILIASKYASALQEIFLVTNRLSAFLMTQNRFEEYLRSRCNGFSGMITILNCEKTLTNITDPKSVYEITQAVISQLKSRHSHLYVNLSSGAGVTSSALVMLSSAYFNDYHLCQAYRNNVSDDKLPEAFSDLILKRTFRTQTSFPESKIIGHSDLIKRAKHIVRRIAPYDYSALILGPSGTGKSTLAREIHRLSARCSSPFREVNCGSLTDELLESTLFGHIKGAFTNAVKDKDGIFKEADGGTLFLDEIADCSLKMQTTLLHVLQCEDNDHPTVRKFRPVGASKDESSDVRIITATNKPIQELVKAGKFREDLFYRISTATITMPPLSSCKDDIESIANHYLSQINNRNKAVAGFMRKSLSPEALDKLRDHTWPGNVRELQNVLQRSCLMTDNEVLTPDDLMFTLSSSATIDDIPSPETFSIENIKAQLELRYIKVALEITGGNKAQTSRLLGMKTPQNLESRLKALNRSLGVI